MTRFAGNAPTNFEVPASVRVCGRVVVAALTKVTIAAAAVLVSAAVVARSPVAHSTKAPPPTLLVSRPFAMSPTQIERCLLEEQRDDPTGFTAARSPDLSEEGLRCPIRILASDVLTFNEKASERL
jgi:hypothetical protein